MRKAALDAAKIAAISCLLVLILELALRGVYHIRNEAVDYVVLPYNAAQDFGPVPPWIDSRRILERDGTLLWRNRRNTQQAYMDVFSPVNEEGDRTVLLRQFIPNLPPALLGNPVWHVSLNSRGFRDQEFRDGKGTGVFRIVCLGDSWTFGANVDQPFAYPQILRRLLAAEFPDIGFEVLNLGVFAYTSYQGLQFLKTEVLRLNPDLVLIGFAMNDASVVGYRDKDYPGDPTPWTRRVLENFETYKLFKYFAQIAEHDPGTIGDYMRKVASVAGTADEVWIGREAHQTADYESLEAYTRVSPNDFETNLEEMIALVRSAGADVMLLYNELWDTPYRTALRRLAARENAPLVDSKKLIDDAKSRLALDLERRLRLEPNDLQGGSDGDATDVVFRVFSGDYPVPEAMYIAGIHDELGDGVPNTIEMYDDGTNGDQRAGDRVWSYSARLPAGDTILYVYTNSGEQGRWQGLDVPEIRRLTVPPASEGTRVYRPIETFGEIYLQADGWHTNAAGYEMIARSILQQLKRNPRFMSHVVQHGDP